MGHVPLSLRSGVGPSLGYRLKPDPCMLAHCRIWSAAVCTRRISYRLQSRSLVNWPSLNLVTGEHVNVDHLDDFEL